MNLFALKEKNKAEYNRTEFMRETVSYILKQLSVKNF